LNAPTNQEKKEKMKMKGIGVGHDGQPLENCHSLYPLFGKMGKITAAKVPL
jgi:hypothetical protein